MDTTGPAANRGECGLGEPASRGRCRRVRHIHQHSEQNWEAVVPLELRNANFYILPFDNTVSANGLPLSTGVAIANLSPYSRPPVKAKILNDGGLQIDNETIQMDPLGHTSFLLGGTYPKTAGVRGSVIFTPNRADRSACWGCATMGRH